MTDYSSYEVLNYIEREETTGALLITGKWGCGKTTLIKRIKDKLNNDDKYAVIMVSLFGVNSVELLTKKIKQEISYVRTIKFDEKGKRILENLKLKQKASVLASALSDYSNLAKGAHALLSVDLYDFINIEKKITCINKTSRKNSTVKKNLVIVFDDFERCKIDKATLLGVINDYVENRGIKSIIIADEDKIDDDSYKEFKEKAIFRTVKMSSDYDTIIRNIVDSYRKGSCSYKEFLQNNVDIIICAFSNSQYENIRTIKSIIYDFERVYDTWKDFGKGKDDILLCLYKFIAIASEYKAGNYGYIEHYGLYMVSVPIEDIDKETDEKKRQEIIDREINEIKNKYQENTFNGFFSSLSRYIVHGYWNKDYFRKELENRYNVTELSDIEKFFSYSIWDLNSATLKIGMQSALQLAYNGELNCEQIVSLLKKIHFLKKIDEDFVGEINYSNIEAAFDERMIKIKNNELQETRFRLFGNEKDEVDDDAKPIIKKIDKLIYLFDAWCDYNEFKAILQGKIDNWQYNSFITTIDVFDDDLLSLFIEKYNSSTNRDKKCLSRLLLKMEWKSNFHSTEDDISISRNNLSKLLSYINDSIENEKDVITLYVLKEFRDKLEEYIK